MKRIHAFEFNERAGVPRFIRDSIVETLGNGLRWGRIYDRIGPIFAEFADRTHVGSVLDLCSGSGEPCSILIEALERHGIRPPRFVLSDLFPNVEAMERVAARHPGAITPVREPVDATAVPRDKDQPARTVISAFHHFPPELAKAILADSVAKKRAIFIVEGFPRRLPRLFSIIPIMTLAMFANPIIARRDNLAKAVFTWLLPVIPLAGLWDAVVSVCRIHSEDELRAMAASVGGEYDWIYSEVPFFPGGRATVFAGLPRP